MPAKHAYLSASSSYRWIMCPPSARLCAGHEDRASPYALEGTDAHSLAEYKIRSALGEKVRDPREDLTWYNREMDRCTDDYCSFVMEQLVEAGNYCSDPLIMVEQRLDFSRWVPEGFGTGDCVIVADHLLQVIDFKYGLGILVDARKNSQMMCYALGALEQFGCIYDIETIKMTIFQPRRDNISTYVMNRDQLLEWAENVLKPAAELAYKGEGKFRAGEHCQFCKAKATCRKRAERNLELAQYDFKMPEYLTENEVAAILPRIDEFTAWANDVKEYALKQALSGTQYPGFKVVAGRANRRYTDEKAVAEAAEAAGFDPYEKKLLGISAMTSLMGKKKFTEVLGSLLTKPQGKPTLVPESDKRPALNSAKDDFEE